MKRFVYRMPTADAARKAVLAIRKIWKGAIAEKALYDRGDLRAVIGGGLGVGDNAGTHEAKEKYEYRVRLHINDWKVDYEQLWQVESNVAETAGTMRRLIATAKAEIVKRGGVEEPDK